MHPSSIHRDAHKLKEALIKIRKNKKIYFENQRFKTQKIAFKRRTQLTGEMYENRSFDCFFVIRFANLPIPIGYSRHGVASKRVTQTKVQNKAYKFESQFYGMKGLFAIFRKIIGTSMNIH